MNDEEKSIQGILQETQQALGVLLREQEEMIVKLKARVSTVSSV